MKILSKVKRLIGICEQWPWCWKRASVNVFGHRFCEGCGVAVAVAVAETIVERDGSFAFEVAG